MRSLVRNLETHPERRAAVRGRLADIVQPRRRQRLLRRGTRGARAPVGGGGQLPWQLADLMLVRLDRLSDQAREVARVAAVAGRRVSHAQLAAVIDLPAAELDAALRETVDAHVLEPTASGRGYVFRHALLAEAVYDDLLPGERVRIHAAYAAALGQVRRRQRRRAGPARAGLARPRHRLRASGGPATRRWPWPHRRRRCSTTKRRSSSTTTATAPSSSTRQLGGRHGRGRRRGRPPGPGREARRRRAGRAARRRAADTCRAELRLRPGHRGRGRASRASTSCTRPPRRCASSPADPPTAFWARLAAAARPGAADLRPRGRGGAAGPSGRWHAAEAVGAVDAASNARTTLVLLERAQTTRPRRVRGTARRRGRGRAPVRRRRRRTAQPLQPSATATWPLCDFDTARARLRARRPSGPSRSGDAVGAASA